MRISFSSDSADFEERLLKRGVTRRDFMKFCLSTATAMGMSVAFAGDVAEAFASPKRPVLIHLNTASCNGCSTSILNTGAPFVDELIFDIISLDYNETFMAVAGEDAMKCLEKVLKSKKEFICILEGAIPTADRGIYGYIGDETMYDLCSKLLPKAKKVIAYGTCAAFGGIMATLPNASRSKGVNEAFSHLGVSAINIPGCTPNATNLACAITMLIRGDTIELDDLGRPTMFFGRTVHDMCERRKFFESGKFATSFDSDGARKGWCLYELGCKGPLTLNNCPKSVFNGVNWCVKAGHPCIGCSNPGFWDTMSPFYEN